ncbi:MAG: hypothetical protein F6K17_05815, partial [Okeania sp. SIO3C4]|nr:hypothetical protein [Okeania sp. SIO3C4]
MSKKESSLNSISFRGKKIEPSQKRTKSISSRLSDEEFEIFNQLCKETGLEGGVYIRYVVLGNEYKLPARVPEINREVWLELSKLCANLNQYQKAINRGVATSYPPGMLETVKELVEQLRA